MKRDDSQMRTGSGGVVMLMDRGMVLWRSARITLSSPAAPAQALRWPIWDLTLPTATDSGAAPRKTVLMPFSSVMSPTRVPVPCPSTMVTSLGSTCAAAYARSMQSTWPASVGE